MKKQNKKHNTQFITLTCMCSPVSLEFIAPGESLSTEHPVANKGPLPTVPAQVGSQVGRFPIHLRTAGNVTDMLLLLTHA